MDDDADALAVRLDGMSSRALTFFPLPWRVIFLVALAILCWASNLHFLHFMGVDTAYVLDMHSHNSMQHLRPFSSASSRHSVTPCANSGRLYLAVYKLFAAYSAWSFGCWLLFRALCGGDDKVMDNYKIVPEVCTVVILAALICPFNVVRKRERDLFLQGLYRCLFSPVNQPIYFSDVVLADIFTSFAKVIGDVWISMRMLGPQGNLHTLPIDEGRLQWVLPCLMSLPYAARLRQCIVEYLSSHNRSNRRALFNAVKYATAFPVIFLSAAQRIVVSELVAEKGTQAVHTPWHGEHQLFRLWLLAIAVNSGYSFWWDVTNDWGLTLLPKSETTEEASSSPPRPLLLPLLQKSHTTLPLSSIHIEDLQPSSTNGSPRSSTHEPLTQRYPRGLRPILLFNDPIVYYMAIALNLVLRCTWSLKLSSHLHSVADLEGGVFLLETLELIRRWVWVFFRVEWEAVKKGVEIGTVSGQIVEDEVELDYQGGHDGLS